MSKKHLGDFLKSYLDRRLDLETRASELRVLGYKHASHLDKEQRYKEIEEFEKEISNTNLTKDHMKDLFGRTEKWKGYLLDSPSSGKSNLNSEKGQKSWLEEIFGNGDILKFLKILKEGVVVAGSLCGLYLGLERGLKYLERRDQEIFEKTFESMKDGINE